MSRELAQGMGQLLAAMGGRGHYFHYTNDPSSKLCYAHYSDPTFDGDGAIIYGAKEGVTEWIESEDLPLMTGVLMRELEALYGMVDTAYRRQHRIRAVLNRPDITLRCIIARTNQQDGYTRTRYGISE